MAKPLTVYDVCKYVNCNNGKLTGHRLFRFPTELQRQQLWIDNSGNQLLSNWSASSIRTAGLCNRHFQDEDFMDATKTRLRRNRNPISWIMEQRPQQYPDQQQQDAYPDQQQQEDVHPQQQQQDVHPHQQQQEEMQWEQQRGQQQQQCKINAVIDEPTFNPTKVNVTYPSAKQSFCTIYEKDTDLGYLQNDYNLSSMNAAFTEATTSRTKTSRCCRLYARSKQKIVNSLINKVKQLQKSVKAEKMKNRRLLKKFKRDKSRNISVSDFLANKQLSDTAKTMIKLQLHKAKSPYAKDEKDLSKQMYYHSAACYTRLRNAGLNLPSESTVRNWVSEYDVVPGVNNLILERLKINLNNMPEDERVCALKFDEMSIKAYEEYSKKFDIIEGLVDMGKNYRSRQVAKHALLFCLDSINAKNPWRQLLAFGFNEHGATAEELLEIIQTLLIELKKINADVRLIVCDQGSNNQKLFKILNVNVEKPYFFVNDIKYFGTFDWPHLIKRLLAQLRSHDKILINGNVIISFNDLIKTWELDKSHGTSNLLGHLSDNHFNPNSFDAMKVKLAFQLLSKRMASAIRIAGKDANGLMSSRSWQASADFVDNLDAVIDACNSLYLNSKNPLKRPLSDRNPEIQQRLEKFVPWSKEWVIQQTGKNFSKPPCFSGIPLTVQALLSLFHDLKLDFPNFELATGLCNQDSVEHVHSKLRGRGGFNANPTCRMYRLAFRHILLTDFIHSSNKGNVACQDSRSLIESSSEDICYMKQPENLTNDVDLLEYESKELKEIQELIEAADLMDLYINVDSSEMPAMTDRDMFESNAITFFAGYIAKKCLSKFSCLECNNVFIKDVNSLTTDNEEYIKYREYSHTDPNMPEIMYLTRPTDFFTNVINCQLEAFHMYHESVWHQRKLLFHLLEIVESYTREKFPDWFDQDNICYEHRMHALKFLLTVKIFAKTREHNRATKQFNKKSIVSKNQKLKNIKNI